MSLGGRMDANPRNSSSHSSSTYKGQHAPSIPGAAPKRSFDDVLYPQSSPNPGHGVKNENGKGNGNMNEKEKESGKGSAFWNDAIRGGRGDESRNADSKLGRSELQQELQGINAVPLC
ncbi:hypothetical protein OIU85_006281 [Salix viminalis]|uniref:Uncharacterized protein n=1 Tax=Salix viminalis TaxID=40686 RepID=A0A9Q0PKK5_SALVM|nr:hypothetical protein OIU85_006281 [Salix viminalis]